MEKNILFGNIDISLPNETIGVFTIFQDLTELFGVEFQSDSVDLLKLELSKYPELKPKPRIDYEADNAQIESRNAETIFKVAEIINGLTVENLKVYISHEEQNEILNRLKTWKRPKAKKWMVGDIFSIELKDGTYMFGQVVGTHLTKTSPVCAVFEIRKQNGEISLGELIGSQVIAIRNTDSECLRKGIFSIIVNEELLADPDRARKDESNGDYHLLDLCNAYYGLVPWNGMYKDTYYESLMLPTIKRPKTALIVSKEERAAYRLEHFRINENNEYVSQSEWEKLMSK